MQKQIKDLETFQKSFNSVYNTEPTLLKEEDWKLRYKLSLEELDEYKEACEQGDIVETYFQSYLLACEEFKKLK